VEVRGASHIGANGRRKDGHILTDIEDTITLISPRGIEKRTLPANAPLPLIEEISFRRS